MKKVILATLLIASSSAFADGKINWTGPYLGASAGYTWGEQQFKDVNFADITSVPGSQVVTDPKPSLDNAFGGLNAGYNFLMNDKTLIGADINVVGGSFDANYQSIGNGFGQDFTAKSKMNWMATLKAKAGMLVGDTLVHVNGGVAFADEEMKIDSLFSGTHYKTSNSQNRTGWVVGLGAEQAIYNNLTAKIDYQHIDFGDENFTINNVDPGLSKIGVKGSDKFDMLSVGFNYHF
jgi:outer membrane immunogenic protein